jgi:hypothetical protein
MTLSIQKYGLQPLRYALFWAYFLASLIRQTLPKGCVDRHYNYLAAERLLTGLIRGSDPVVLSSQMDDLLRRSRLRSAIYLNLLRQYAEVKLEIGLRDGYRRALSLSLGGL